MSRPAVLVTGGAKRIGRAIVERFAAEGWHAVIHYGSSRRAAEELAASLPSAETVRCDLADTAATVTMVRALAERAPGWRALVNCASIFEKDDATGLDVATNDRAMAINARTPAAMAQAFLELAEGPPPRTVIQVTDQKLENTNPDFFSYTMSKHALDATIGMLAKAYPDDRVHGLAPGAILPSHDQDPDETGRSHRLNLLKRKTGAAEVANGALFLASGALASGQTLFVDSGQHLLDQPRDVIYLARGEAGDDR